MKQFFKYLTFLLLATASVHAAAPVINSPSTSTGVVGQPFSYTITTVSGDALSFSDSGLPAGLTRSGNLITGNPDEPGVFAVTLGASNFDGVASQVVTFTITNPVPVITSELTAEARSGRSFSYTITATDSPTGFNAQLGLVGGLTIDTATGVISGVPLNAGNYDIPILAENAAGSSFEILNLVVAPDLGSGGIDSVSITSPSAAAVLSGEFSQFSVQAVVTPAAGETIDTVFVRWTNPPANPNLTPRDPIIVASLSLVSSNGTDFTYSGTIKVGFNPDDREVGGGDITLEVLAYTTSAVDALDYTSDTVSFEIAPVLEFVFPDAGLAMDAILLGDVFASARLSSNNIDTITARIAGESILDTVPGSSSNLNGIYNFQASRNINFPGEYEVRITATDLNGNISEINRPILISDTLSEPVAVITSPGPGFTNEVFSPAIMSFVEESREPVVSAGVTAGFNVTYRLTLISGGQGYYPRNLQDATLSATDASGLTLGVSGIDVINGRIDSLTETFTTFFSVGAPQWPRTGNALIDDLSDPGFNSKVEVSAQFFKANANLEEFEIFVNGKQVLNGNLNPNNGPVVVPVVKYPATGSPAPGDYVVVAQVVDQQGEIGTSEPITFTILPFDPIDITFSRVNNDVVSQGDSVTFDVVPVDPEDYDQIEIVTIFDSDSDVELGTAPKVRIDGVDRFRFTQSFNEQGSFGVYAEAVAFNGQSVRSSPIRIDVQPLNDLRVTLSSPLEDPEIFAQESLSVTADASSTAGIASVSWFVNNQLIETDTEEPYALNYTFEQTGVFSVRATATDNFGNTAGSSQEAVFDDVVNQASQIFITGRGEIEVTVLPTDLIVTLTEPTTNQTIVAGESLDFAATASATLGVSAVRWYVNGILVETDTAAPYAFSQEFPNPGNVTVYAEAEDSLGSRRQTLTRAVTVNSPNPLLRDEDFVAFVYSAIIGTSPTSAQRAEALAALDGSLASRSQFVADLLQSDALQTTSIVQLIYRTMTGEWPDATAVEAGRSVLTNGGTGVVDANALTASLIPEYESRFAVLNTQSGFVNQLFFNKHGTQPNAQSQVRLFYSATGASVTLSNGQVVPGYSGDLTSYATQFTLDNDLSNFIGPDGLPLSSLHLYSYPNNPEDNALLATLISAFWGIEPTEAEINALSGLSLTSAAESVLTDPRYYSQFSTSTLDGGIAQIMATFGVFDLSKNGPDDDADGDGATNLEEIALGSDPSDAADTVEPMTASIDGTDFVVTFIKLADTSTLGGLDFTIQCSPTMAVGSWNDADPSATQNLAADQSGVPTGYERIEFRIDMTTQDCSFVRVIVD